MEIKELFIYRQQLLDDSKDADGYISDSGFLEECLPWLNETKHTESVDVTDIYCLLDNGNIKVNSYTLNESGERLQLFLVHEDTLNPDATDEDLMISQKTVYDKQFNRAISFIKKSIKKQLGDILQDASPAWILIHQLSNSAFIDQIDVIEIFLISAAATIQNRGAMPSAKLLEFDNESLSVSFTRERESCKKDLIIMKHLINLNFLYNVHTNQGGRYPLVIDFTSTSFNHLLPCLHAASEASFDSYLCAIPAPLLSKLYKMYSSRLLEKNVRSFLQLKGVNKGMQDTIRRDPEKFIAYNNGLTITATNSELIKIDGVPHLSSLTDFQIVNGGQTTATLFFSQKLGLNIDKISVMAKINVAKDASEDTLDDLISNISTFSNAQSKVSKVDLRARSTQLVKLKSLSESILTVSGKKWFFERAKGEYATMLRINSGKKTQIEKEFPKERRFSKEELAKYYAAWGDKPYAVKKGGEKIFRLFIEEISGEGKSKKPTVMNRGFYEDLIARIILFRSLEKLYGSGNGSIGQLRSAVVPYSLSAIYSFTTGNKKSRPFDLIKIWKSENLNTEIETFFKDLMVLMNTLIKKYSKSDDLGEYSKKPELWEDISNSIELISFLNNSQNKALVSRFTVTAEEIKKREDELARSKDLNFESLLQMAAIFDKGAIFYQHILNSLEDLSAAKKSKLEIITAAIQHHKEIEETLLQSEKELTQKLIVTNPELFLKIDHTGNLYTITVNFIIKKYNYCLANEKEVKVIFNSLSEFAKKKEVKNYLVFNEIGKLLEKNVLPSIKQIKYASEYVKTL